MPAIFHPVKVAFDESTAESFANGDRCRGKSTSPGRNVETPQISIGHELLHPTVGILAVVKRDLVEDLAPGTWRVFSSWQSARGPIGAPSKSGLWLGPARVIMTGAVQQWSGSVHSTTGQIGVVWVSHGSKLIR